MKNSASSVSDGFLKVWIALGGTTMSSPSVASMLPSGVSNLTVPGLNHLFSDRTDHCYSLFERLYSLFLPLVTRKHSSWKRCQCIGGPEVPFGRAMVTHPTRLSVLLPSSKT